MSVYSKLESLTTISNKCLQCARKTGGEIINAIRNIRPLVPSPAEVTLCVTHALKALFSLLVVNDDYTITIID